MQKRYGRLLCSVVLLAVMLAGCAPTRVEIDYGTSYQLARTQQSLRPAATQHLAPQEDLDGGAAQRTLERYRKTFEKPPAPPSFAISVGGIK